jgi:hypothetical protein
MNVSYYFIIIDNCRDEKALTEFTQRENAGNIFLDQAQHDMRVTIL